MTKYTVLFVDDEPNILKALTRLFRGDHINVFTAPNAAEALEIVRNNKVQVLVTDNLMPGMKGTELIQQVRDISPCTIRIILSGHSDMEAILNAVNKSEVFRFILKPWVDSDLKATVHIALAHYGLQENIIHLKSELDEKNNLLKYLNHHFPDLFTSLPEHLGYKIETESQTGATEAIAQESR